MDIFLAPFFAFFNLSFYKRIIRLSLGKGFLYLLYLSAVYALLIMAYVGADMLPKANEFTDWFAGNLPQVTLTKEGVVTDAPQPFELVHPKYGKILAMDTTRESLDNPPPGFYVYITKTKALARQSGRAESRVYELVPQTAEAKAQWKDVVITGELIKTLYKKFLPYVYPLTFGVVFFVVILWKILAGLFYSLVALLLNNFRREKLPYAALLNCSFFALTPVAVLQAVGIYVPRVAAPLNFLAALVLTSIYLVIAILATQEKPDSIEAPNPSV